MLKKPKDPAHEPQWRQASLALMVPTTMLAGPIAGFLLAQAAFYFFDIPEAWTGRVRIGAILLGTAAGMRESYKILKKISVQPKKRQ